MFVKAHPLQKLKIKLYTKFVNCSDLVGVSTLGNVSAGQVDIRTVDIGKCTRFAKRVALKRMCTSVKYLQAFLGCRDNKI